MESKDKWFAVVALLFTAMGQGLDNVTAPQPWVEVASGTCAALGLGLALFAKSPVQQRKRKLPLPPGEPPK